MWAKEFAGTSAPRTKVQISRRTNGREPTSAWPGRQIDAEGNVCLLTLDKEKNDVPAPGRGLKNQRTKKEVL